MHKFSPLRSIDFLMFYMVSLLVFIINNIKYIDGTELYTFSNIELPVLFDPSIIVPNTPQCIPCEYNNFQKNSDGSKYDFLCSVYFNKVIGIFPFIRTFRQNNKQSPIIVLIDKVGFSSIRFRDKLALGLCGVTIIRTGEVSSHMRGLQIVRLIYFYNFLKECKNYFQRCIYTDGFDVFFQGDPFTTAITAEKIYLTIESETNNFLNTSYYEKFPSFYKTICAHSIVNCGVFAGGTSIMFTFFTHYLKMFPGITAVESQTVNYNNPYSDQDALNYFVYVHLKKMPNLERRLVLLNTSSCFASMIGEVRYQTKNVTWKFPRFSVYYNGRRNIPLLVHQYTYSNILTKSLIDRCGFLEHQRNRTSEYYRA